MSEPGRRPCPEVNSWEGGFATRNTRNIVTTASVPSFTNAENRSATCLHYERSNCYRKESDIVMSVAHSTGRPREIYTSPSLAVRAGDDMTSRVAPLRINMRTPERI